MIGCVLPILRWPSGRERSLVSSPFTQWIKRRGSERLLTIARLAEGRLNAANVYVVDSVIYLCLVAILWGVTNPFMKKGALGLEGVKATSFYGQFVKEIAFLVTNLKYLLPFLVNQCGSVLYFLTLQSTDLSLAVPVSNSLTFVFTAITGWFLGEEKVHRNTYLGMMLVLCGTTLCCWDKVNKTVEL